MTRRRGELDVAGGKRLGDQVRLVARVELVAEVLDVPLDRARCNPQLLRALLRRATAGNALEHLDLSFSQGDEIFLLPRKIHDRSPCWENLLLVPPNRLDCHRLTAS